MYNVMQLTVGVVVFMPVKTVFTAVIVFFIAVSMFSFVGVIGCLDSISAAFSASFCMAVGGAGVIDFLSVFSIDVWFIVWCG